MAVAIELTLVAQTHRTFDPAASQLDDLTSLRAASTAEASQILILEDSRSHLGGALR